MWLCMRLMTFYSQTANRSLHKVDFCCLDCIWLLCDICFVSGDWRTEAWKWPPIQTWRSVEMCSHMCAMRPPQSFHYGYHLHRHLTLFADFHRIWSSNCGFSSDNLSAGSPTHHPRELSRESSRNRFAQLWFRRCWSHSKVISFVDPLRQIDNEVVTEAKFHISIQV